MYRNQSYSKQKSNNMIRDNNNVPLEIFVPKSATTYLCRWDSGDQTDKTHGVVNVNVNAPQEPPKRPERKTVFPKQAPRRLPKIQKHLDRSIQTGIDIGSIRLQPVTFYNDSSATSTTTSAAAAATSGTPKTFVTTTTTLLASATTLSDAILSKRSPRNDPSRLVVKNQSTTANSEAITAVFCIRRPGCGSCRDHGMQLAALIKEELEKSIPITMFGIIKATTKGGKTKNDELLVDFSSQHFPYPLYQDKDWDAFRFLGDRKVSIWKLLTSVPKMERRYKKKGIENVPFGGDIFTQGGVLLFNAAGQLKYVYYERYGDELDTDALRWAIQDIHKSDAAAIDAAATTATIRSSTNTVSTVTSTAFGDSLHSTISSASSRTHDSRCPATKCSDGVPRKPTRVSEGASRWV